MKKYCLNLRRSFTWIFSAALKWSKYADNVYTYQIYDWPFSSNVYREVIRKHVEYEYKLVRREKNVKDFHEYITYKKDFLKLARIRMKVSCNPFSWHNFSELVHYLKIWFQSASVNKKDRRRIERMLVTHTSKLYDSMVKYFSADVSLWQEYIEFMIKEVIFISFWISLVGS